MSLTINCSNKEYDHLQGLELTQGLKNASGNLLKILKKIKINSKDFTINLTGDPTTRFSFLDNTLDFIDSLSKLNTKDIEAMKEIDIAINSIESVMQINYEIEGFKLPEKYEDLKTKVIKHITQLIENSKEKPGVYFEYNDEEVSNQQPVNVGSGSANDNEVDELEKTYIARDDDLHQVKVRYKKGIEEQTRHIVFGNEKLPKQNNKDHEKTAEKMIDLYSKETDKEERLIAKSQDETSAILDSVDYQKDAVTVIITGANVCYSKETTDAITKILADNNANITKDEFIKATSNLRTAIYIVIPGTDKYAKYQLMPKKGNLVFEMEENCFTRGSGKFKKSNNKVEYQDKNKLPKVDSFKIYQTNQNQEQALWKDKGPNSFMIPTEVKVTKTAVRKE